MDQQGFPWEWVLLVVSSFGFCVFLAFDFPGFFFFLFFCLVRGEKKGSLAHGILVGNQRESATLGRGFVYLVTILYCSDIVWSEDLSAYFFFFRSLIENFSFLFFFACEGKN